MSDQNREDENTDPTAPSAQWEQPNEYGGDSTAPPPPPPSAPYGTPPPGPTPYPAADPAQGDFGQPGQTPPPPPPGTSPYGAASAPYGDPNAPYGAPPAAYYQQAPAQQNTSALVLTILSGIGVFACCGVTIVGLVLGIIAMTKQSTDPVQSAKLTKWGWIGFGAGLALSVIAVILYIVGMIAWMPEFADPGY